MEKYDRGKIAYWLASFIGIGGITQLLIFPNQNWFFWIAIILSLLILTSTSTHSRPNSNAVEMDFKVFSGSKSLTPL